MNNGEGSNDLGTDHRFIGHPSTLFRNQKPDGTGLMYYNARYYDPDIGQFISPDSIVPDPTNVFAYNRYMYVLGNPLRYTDPSGHDYRDVLNNISNFFQGIGAQTGYNNTAIVLPGEMNYYAPQNDESVAMQAGRFVGDVISMIQGGYEVVIGISTGVGGTAICATGVGCLVGAPAAVAGVAIAAHGSTVLVNGASHAGTQFGNLYHSMTDGNKSGITKSGHAHQRASEGRPTGNAHNDSIRANKSDIFIQPDGRFVVRGPNQREHIISSDGTLSTTLRRSNNAHRLKIRDHERIPVTYDQFEEFQRIFQP